MFSFHLAPSDTGGTVPPDVISSFPHGNASGAMNAADRIADHVMGRRRLSRPEDGRRPMHRPQDVELNSRTTVLGERTE
jgi:hypothetical protein